MAKKSNIETFRLNNLTGGINSIAEQDALISFGGAAEASDIENFTPIYRGGQSQTLGYNLFQNIGTGPVTGLYRFIKSDGTNLMIVANGSTAYKLINATLTPIANVSNGAYLNFETANDNLVICDGINPGQLYNGSVTVPLTNGGAPSVITQSLFYQNRLWLITPTSPNKSLVYYSNANDINSGTSNYSAQFVQCDYNDGQSITSISKYFIAGQIEPVIFVTKTRSVGIILGDGSAGNPYTFVKINLDYGVAGTHQVVQFGQTIAYLTPNGVASFSSADNQVKLEFNYLSEKVRNLFQLFNQNTIKNAIAYYDWLNTRISFAVPEANQTYNNVVWHYDVRLGCWYKERYGNTTAVLIDTNGTRYHGDENGNIFIHTPNAISFNGNAIQSYYKTPYLDFGDPNIRKRILDAKISTRAQGTYSLTINNSLDYGQRTGRLNTIYMNSQGALWSGTTSGKQWGSAGKWGQGAVWISSGSITTVANPVYWGGGAIWGTGNTQQTTRWLPSGYFRNIQFTLQQNGLNQPVAVFEIEFTVEFEGV